MSDKLRCSMCRETKPADAFFKRKDRPRGYTSLCRDCIGKYRTGRRDTERRQARERFKRRYREAPEKYREKAARERQIDPAVHRMRCRNWYWRNPEAARARVRRYNAEHRDGRARAYQAWRAKGDNRIRTNEAKRQWVRRHPFAYRKWQMDRRARMAKARVGRIDWKGIIVRDIGRCGICSAPIHPKDLSFDHIIPLSRGGAHATENIQLAHIKCNNRKGRRVA